jgi:hypothetical protein
MVDMGVVRDTFTRQFSRTDSAISHHDAGWRWSRYATVLVTVARGIRRSAPLLGD